MSSLAWDVGDYALKTLSGCGVDDHYLQAWLPCTSEPSPGCINAANRWPCSSWMNLGFVPFDRTGRGLLFNLLSDRNERRSTLVTTNLSIANGPKSSRLRSCPPPCWTA